MEENYHNLFLQVDETLKCQINTTIQKQFLKSVSVVSGCVFLSRYSIDRNTDLERFFNVDALSGVISTAKPLDREANSVHNLTIFAIESRKFTYTLKSAVPVRVDRLLNPSPE